LTWEVEAILDGARDDLAFIPVSMDYENVVESKSYSRELLGAEKKPEDLKALLTAPRVLARRYGRIHVTFAPPVRLRELMHSRGLGRPLRFCRFAAVAFPRPSSRHGWTRFAGWPSQSTCPSRRHWLAMARTPLRPGPS